MKEIWKICLKCIAYKFDKLVLRIWISEWFFLLLQGKEGKTQKNWKLQSIESSSHIL